MSLRLRILLFLFLFGLAPLLLAVVINLPLVLERVDLFYRHAFLQNLRADFSDLDQHLASRDASVRLLAKLPEPGVLIAGDGEDQAEVDLARARYIQWINRILGDERDITEILFLDDQGVERFWLERAADTGEWRPTTRRPRGVTPEQIARLLSGRSNHVALGPLQVDLDAADPARVFTLQLLSPIVALSPGGPPAGLVAITLDIGGLVRRDERTLWVHEDGGYLRLPDQAARPGNAFDDFPGLADDLANGRMVLWERGDRRAIWVPMFRTVDGQTLWVGRPVDSEPLRAFRTEISVRVLLIVLALVIVLFLVARWIARRATQMGHELIEGVRQTLESDRAASFDWSGPPELRRLSADLTRLTHTHASQTRNLRAHARELEATNRYKSEFLANVSHELRTPLNSMLLLSKLLTGDPNLSDEARQRAQVIHAAGGDLKALIDNILDLSRIEAGRLDLTVEPVVLRELLGDLHLLLAAQFEHKGLALTVEIAADAPASIETDVDKVRQVMKNFLANAVKFTARGGVTLSARAAAPPYAAALVVTDTGIGIARDKQQAIFEAFQQADGSTSRRYGGTGLGLTISRQLAELLGGEIRLLSEPGRGAEFSLLLPARCNGDAGANPMPVPAAPPPADDEPPPTTGRLRGRSLLLITAGVRNQLRLSGMLGDWGLDLHLAGDIDEARETLDELGRVDFLLADAVMPGGDGCDTIHAMRDHLAADTVVIGLLAPSGEDAREACLAQGANEVVSMPVDAHALSEVLNRYLPASADQEMR